jgi:myosin heavy subunit
METKYDKLQLFFDNIKTISFWQRLFSWKTLRQLSYEAYEEFKSLLSSLAEMVEKSTESANTLSSLKIDNERFNSDLQALKPELEHAKEALQTANKEISELKASIASKDETIRQTEKRNTELDKELSLLKQKVEQLASRQSELEQENTAFKESENNRITEHEKKMTLLTGEIERIRNERQREKDDALREATEKFEKMRQMWAKHQEETKKAIKMICQKHTIEYVEKVPFKGSPDNTIKIADEFVVFDAKSPAKDDLQNFPNYIKNQADGVKKYVNEDSVRKEVFLVIPSNTTEVIKQFTYNMGDYIVYVVTLDALEPLILSLKRIEAYEFVDQLSPEERENICRIVGKFAHIAKRRIQIDHFFAWEFLDVLTKCKADLPKEILEKVIEFEKAEKLNPPQERRAKQILTKDLQSDSDKIQREAEAKAIIFPPSLQSNLRELPLYEEDKTDPSD